MVHTRQYRKLQKDSMYGLFWKPFLKRKQEKKLKLSFAERKKSKKALGRRGKGESQVCFLNSISFYFFSQLDPSNG